jgi:acetyltransferase-like isoleucine patch superfamily enzyme
MIRKGIEFIKKYGFLVLFFKIIYVVNRPLKFKIISKIKGLYYFRNSSITLGSNISISSPFFKSQIGKNVVIYSNSIFEFCENSDFSIGNNSLLSYGVLVSCNDKIYIGENTQIGEYTSIRDTTHNYIENGVPMKYNKDISKAIVIGNNVWIGRGCVILPGTIIEDGVVVGANSIVKGLLKSNCIYAGVPIKFVKNRID